MKKILNLLSLAALALATTATAQTTNFTNASPTNTFLSNAGNWSNGLPTGGTEGTVAVNAGYDSATTLTGYDIVHSAGALSLGSGGGFGTLTLSGTTWLMNGTATYTGRGLSLTNSSSYEIDLGAGTANYSANSSNVLIATASTMLVTSGNVFSGTSINVNGTGATFTMNSPGTVSLSNVASTFGANPLAVTGGEINLNAGTITASRFMLRAGIEVAFGGSTIGSASFTDWGSGVYTSTGDRAQDNDFTLNFKPNTLMSLTLSSTARALNFTGNSGGTPTTLAWAEALWGQNQLLYNGQSGADLGLTWGQVTTTGFADGNLFAFSQLGSFGGTLTVVPEPSTWAVLSVGIILLMTLRRRRQA